MTTETTYAGGVGLHHGWTEGDNGWDVGMETNLLLLNMLVQPRVIGQLTTQPGSPTDGDMYLTGAAASGADWSGHNNSLAAYVGSTWYFYAPQNGLKVYNVALAKDVQYDGTAWRILSGAGEGTVVLLAEITTSGSQASVTFDSIPDTYRDIIIRVRGRGDTAAAAIDIRAVINGDTGNNYHYEDLHASSTTSVITENVSQASLFLGYLPAASSTSNYAGMIETTLADYLGTTFFKAMISKYSFSLGTGSFSQGIGTSSGEWISTAAIDSIKVLPSAGAFVDGCIVSLYGVAAEISAGPGSGSGGRMLFDLGTLPPLTDFTQVNVTGSVSVVENPGAALTLLNTSSPADSGIYVSALAKAPPSAPYIVGAFMVPDGLANNFVNIAFGFRDAATGKMELVDCLVTSGQSMQFEHATWASPTSRASATTITGANAFPLAAGGIWVGVGNDGAGNVTWYTSNSGGVWIPIHTIATSGGYLADYTSEIVFGTAWDADSAHTNGLSTILAASMLAYDEDVGSRKVGVKPTQGGPGGMTLIDMATPSGLSTFNFASIPKKFKNLEIVGNFQSTHATSTALRVRFNGDTGNNYYGQRTYSNDNNPAEGVNNGAAASSAFMCDAPGQTAAGNFAQTLRATIALYGSTGFNKSLKGVGSFPGDSPSSSEFDTSTSSWWANTAPITDMTLFLQDGDFVAGSEFLLYGW